MLLELQRELRRQSFSSEQDRRRGESSGADRAAQKHLSASAFEPGQPIAQREALSATFARFDVMNERDAEEVPDSSRESGSGRYGSSNLMIPDPDEDEDEDDEDAAAELLNRLGDADDRVIDIDCLLETGEDKDETNHAYVSNYVTVKRQKPWLQKYLPFVWKLLRKRRRRKKF
jgi:hypothetical protein